MIKTKKIIAALTVVCLMFSFAAASVSANERTVENVYRLETPIRADQLRADLTAVLFPQESAGALYPGEVLESAIEIVNDTGRMQTVTMTVRKGDVNTKNLADVIDLTVTRVRDGVDEPIHTGVKLSELGTRETSISFTNNETAVYRFEAYFNPAGNEYMAASTDFQVIFTVTATTVTPDRPYVPGVPGGGDDDDDNEYGGVPNVTRPPAAPAPTTAATISMPENTVPMAGMTPEETTAANETTTTAPPEVETTTAQEYFEMPENTVPMAGMTPEETTEAATTTTAPPETTVSGTPEQRTTTETEYYEFEPEEIPLMEFLDKLPTTGETTNPLVYQMTGLGFMFAGSAVIFGVSRKNKQKN